MLLSTSRKITRLCVNTIFHFVLDIRANCSSASVSCRQGGIRGICGFHLQDLSCVPLNHFILDSQDYNATSGTHNKMLCVIFHSGFRSVRLPSMTSSPATPFCLHPSTANGKFNRLWHVQPSRDGMAEYIPTPPPYFSISESLGFPNLILSSCFPEVVLKQAKSGPSPRCCWTETPRCHSQLWQWRRRMGIVIQ